MGVFNKLKNVFGVEDDDYDDDEYEDEVDLEEDEVQNTFKADFSQIKKEKNVSLSGLSPQLQVVLVKPERFDDASGIADSLNSKKTVVLNLEATSKEVSRRLVDFLSGVAYANNGQIKKIANSTFIITPYNVDISGIGILDEIDSSSIY